MPVRSSLGRGIAPADVHQQFGKPSGASCLEVLRVQCRRRGCGCGGGVARRGSVGLAVRGARPPGLRAGGVSSPVSPAGPPDARLRGGAPHEAERRCGARDGGAGRMGSPATRRRLCVLFQIGDQLVAGLEQFLFVDDVVAVEDGAGLVAGQEHGDALGDAGADQVAGGGAAAIVEEAGRHAGP